MLPFLALVAFAGYLGLRAGQVPTETEIIHRYAATYVSTMGAGAQPTDCVATSGPDPAVRMVITCTHSGGLVTTYFAGPRGQAVDPASLDVPDT